jgi:Ca-activated chloride channel family protein
MNTTNQNHDSTTPEDLPDRLVDLALSELVGGHAPPNLSSRIAAATFRQPAAVGQVPRTRQDRAFWVNLAVAAMLLIGVTIVLLPSFQSARQSARVAPVEDRVGNEFGSQHGISKSIPVTAAAPLRGNSKPTIATAKNALDSLTELNHSTITTDGADMGDAATPSATSNLSLGVVAPSHAFYNQHGSNLNYSDSPYQPNLSQVISDSTSTDQTHVAQFSGSASGGSASATISQAAPMAGHLNVDSSSPIPAASASADPAKAYATPYNKTVVRMQSAAGTLGSHPSDDVALLVNGRDAVTVFGTNSGGFQFSKSSPEPTAAPRIGPLGPEGIGPDSSGDRYTPIVENPFIKAEGGAAVSTFSIDVDTASYANVRQFLLEMNQLPPPDAVRIEELVNYFKYNYAPPISPDAPVPYNTVMANAYVEARNKDFPPFAAHVEVTSCPWAPEHRLARIGIKGREMDRNKRPQSNLVFLVDVSGSMNEPAKLPLVVYGLEQLTRELGENDHIAIVVYAGTEGLVLPSTSGSKQDTILAALAKLQAGGSTAGGAGIQLAYQIAEDNFIKGGTNRVILCTDGDFNVGVTSTADLQRLVEKKAKDTGVFISTLGFGRGNLNDAMMVAISDHGNGNYHYIDNRTEARRVLVQEMTGTLVTISKDVKIQVEFNPAKVSGYRLIGYEKRMLRTEDFNDDKKDAGEIGAGHTVTALYEIVPAGKKVEIAPVDDLKYQTAVSNSDDHAKLLPGTNKELLTLKMRYKAPDGDTSKKLEWPITDDGKSFSAASADLKFAASVAGFGLLLRNSQFKGNLTFAAAIELAQGGIGEDPHGYRKEFLDMVRKAKELRHE